MTEVRRLRSSFGGWGCEGLEKAVPNEGLLRAGLRPEGASLRAVPDTPEAAPEAGSSEADPPSTATQGRNSETLRPLPNPRLRRPTVDAATPACPRTVQEANQRPSPRRDEAFANTRPQRAALNPQCGAERRPAWIGVFAIRRRKEVTAHDNDRMAARRDVPPARRDVLPAQAAQEVEGPPRRRCSGAGSRRRASPLLDSSCQTRAIETANARRMCRQCAVRAWNRPDPAGSERHETEPPSEGIPMLRAEVPGMAAEVQNPSQKKRY